MHPSDRIEPGFAPYTPPEATLELPRPNYRRVDAVRVGQRIVLVSMLTLVVLVAVAMVLHPWAEMLVQLGSLQLPVLLALYCVAVIAYVIGSLIGYAKMLLGLNRTWFSTIILFMGYFLPVIHWLVIYLVNSEATDFLRRSGLKVGLFGARRPAPPPRIER